MKQGTQVVYLATAIVTDAATWTARPSSIGSRNSSAARGATLHAVAVSSSYDAAVLRGIAGIGGGSLRQVSGEVGPQQTAKNLLAEMTRPALRNIQLEFKRPPHGPRLSPRAAERPRRHAADRAGAVPAASDVEQAGEVIVTGTLEGSW